MREESEWSKMYNAAMEPIQKAVCEAVKKNGDEECYVFYSAYQTDDNDCPINNLSDIAISGKVKFVEQGDDFFGSGASYTSKVLVNPTWLDVCVVANEMILKTNDKHHIYLEGCIATEKTLFQDNHEVKIVRFMMGS